MAFADSAAWLLIHFPRGDCDPDCEILRRVSASYTSYRHGRSVIKSHAGPTIGGGGTDAVGGIESDPSEIFDVGLGPGVARSIFLGFGAGPYIAADVSGWNAQVPRRSEEDVSMVLANADAALERLGG